MLTTSPPDPPPVGLLVSESHEEQPPVTDRALVRGAALGDADAFQELFHRHFASTFAYALNMLDGDRALAEDATQNAWIKAWRGMGAFRGDSKVRTWLFSIVAREVLDSRRRRRPVLVDDEVLAQLGQTGAPSDHGGGPEAAVVDGELWTQLAIALAELPWRQRAVWLLREFEEMSYDDMAFVIGSSNAVVRGQLHRARRALATRMEEWR